MGRQRGCCVVCLGGGGGGGTPGRILSKCGQTLFSVYEVYADALPHCEWYPRVAAEMCVTRQGRAGTICARPTLRDGGGIGGWPSGQVGLSPPGSGPTRVVPTRVWPHQGHLVPTSANRCAPSKQRGNKQTNLCTPLSLQTDIGKRRC